MSTASYEDLSDLLFDCRMKALGEWRAMYAPHVAISDLFANHLRRLRMVCDERPGGVLQVAIKVQPRRAADAEWYFWKVRLLAGRYQVI